MQVVKRDGTLEDFNPSKIQKRILDRCEGLKVNGDEVAVKVIGGFADRMTTVELDNLAAEIAATMTMNHPDYSYLASRIAISRLHKETPNRFRDCVGALNLTTDLLNNKFSQFVLDYSGLYQAMIDYDRDYNFDYFGYKTLERAYLLRGLEDKVIERPQHLWMRVAVAIWEDNLEMVKQTYDDLSQGLYIHATPTLFNAGTKHQQLSSCFLIANKGDDKEALMDTLKDVSVISSYAGGIGLHVHDVRAEGSLIAGSGGKSNGLRPMLKTYNEASKWWDQGGGKRKGSFAIYLEPWHKDIHFFLEMRNNHGKEELRARDLFNALWIPDLFMERVEAHDKWTLFCPNEVLKYNGVKLQELVGEDFKNAYEQLEQHSGLGVTIKAQDLWSAILKAQMETGTPYMGYKDAVNLKSNQKNLGVIKSSNLCIEINEYSSKDEQAVCNLGSLALPKFIREVSSHLKYGERTDSMVIAHPIKYELDHEALYEATYQLTLNLNRVIDINFYPTIETKNSNMRHRPIGIGVQGLADVFAIMKLPFDSQEALTLNNEIFETIYFAFLSASNDLAQQKGETYESYEGSPASKGLLQYNLWDVLPTKHDWAKLKIKIAHYGLYNSLGIALMPTASTSQILGNNECFEPFNSNLSTRGTLAGTFVIINKHLVKDLEELGLWNPAMKNKLVVSNGSIQTIPGIPQNLKDIYKTAYEIKQKVILDMAAGRGPYVDQAQSMNIFMEGVTVSKLSSMHFYGWKKGLKTGMYYLRQKAAADAIKFTAEKEIAPLACSIDNPDCEACGA